MWSTTGPRPLFSSFSRKLFTSSGSRGLNFQPRGFRVKTWKVSHLSAAAVSTALSKDLAMETWTPTLTVTCHLSVVQLSYERRLPVVDFWVSVIGVLQKCLSDHSCPQGLHL